MSVFTGDVSDMISIDKQREYLEYMSNNGYAFAIVNKATDEPIGICKLTQVDLINRKSTLGIFIGEKSCWDKGFGTEATKLIKDCAFLNGYYIETRYPAEDPLVADEDDVKDGLSFTENIINFINKNL